MEEADILELWKRIQIPHEKRKNPNPIVHELKVKLHGYDGETCQIILCGNGRENPFFLITNDFNFLRASGG